MSRYTGPSYKKSRRVGFSTLENGKDLARRNYKPGMHGAKRQGKLSNYGDIKFSQFAIRDKFSIVPYTKFLKVKETSRKKFPCRARDSVSQKCRGAAPCPA